MLLSFSHCLHSCWDQEAGSISHYSSGKNLFLVNSFLFLLSPIMSPSMQILHPGYRKNVLNGCNAKLRCGKVYPCHVSHELTYSTSCMKSWPQFEKIDCVGQVSRYLPIGTEIITLSAIDFDAGNIISYRIVGGNEDGCFSLDSTAGVVTVTCDLSDVGVSERELNVTATDGTHFADVVRVLIKLVNSKKTSAAPLQDLLDDTRGFDCKDTNVAKRLTEVLAASDKSNSPRKGEREEFAMMPSRYGENVHSPEFINFPTNIQVNESMQIGSTLVRIKARDRDLGYNGKLIYGISSGDHDSVFRLDPDSGELKVIGFLDRERESEYLLNVTVYDQGRPQKSNSRMIPITVLDVNDNPPKFKNALASFRVSENAHNGTSIFRVNATDIDDGDNANIRYSLVTDTDDFQVDPFTGVLSVSGPLDRERQELYELVIRASDCANAPASTLALHSDALIRVIVDDINDNVPSFSLSTYSVKAREDIPVGTVIAILSASDPDLGSGGELRYSLVGQAEGDHAFKIDELSGSIRIVKPLDFEDRQVHSLTVRAKDRGSPSLSSEVTLIVEVVDVNENAYPPVFPDFVAAAAIPENQPIGSFVTRVEASDADSPTSDDSRVGYSIVAGDGLGYFSIDNEGFIFWFAKGDLVSSGNLFVRVFKNRSPKASGCPSYIVVATSKEIGIQKIKKRSLQIIGPVFCKNAQIVSSSRNLKKDCEFRESSAYIIQLVRNVFPRTDIFLGTPSACNYIYYGITDTDPCEKLNDWFSFETGSWPVKELPSLWARDRARYRPSNRFVLLQPWANLPCHLWARVHSLALPTRDQLFNCPHQFSPYLYAKAPNLLFYLWRLNHNRAYCRSFSSRTHGIDRILMTYWCSPILRCFRTKMAYLGYERALLTKFSPLYKKPLFNGFTLEPYLEFNLSIEAKKDLYLVSAIKWLADDRLFPGNLSINCAKVLRWNELVLRGVEETAQTTALGASLTRNDDPDLNIPRVLFRESRLLYLCPRDGDTFLLLLVFLSIFVLPKRINAVRWKSLKKTLRGELKNMIADRSV
ncbi:unnamed protein product [Nesidiocoris tenuis]|uniref:Cadherin domain-containing protein n=1 Tax=Nesidiocoris tenuis TaxID=355587 RepID=A0A6H5GYY9_9HEMI|nr:unnamed protein product [Nesidiocoris tenuis]